MHRLQRLLAAVTFLTLLAVPAWGQYTRDNAATKKIDEAINTHYLATEFDKAEGVLTGTINACGDKCSPQVLAKAWMYVGIIRGSGKNDMGGAKEAFQKALGIDPNVKLDSAIATPETQKVFQDAGGSGTAAPPPPPPAGEEKQPKKQHDEASGEGVTCTPTVREVQTRRPVPVECTTDEEATAMELRYKPFGSDTWKSLKMDKKGEAFRAEVPCDATQDQGPLKIYVRAKDAQGEPVASWGTKSKPIELNIGETVSAEPPAYEGSEAPQRCAAKEECPPDFPGCGPSGPKRGNKDWGANCDNSSECKEGLLCMSGTCDTAPSCEQDSDCDTGTCSGGKCDIGESAGESTKPFKKHWVGLHIAQDVAIIGGSDVCSRAAQQNDNFACFYKDLDSPYTGQPFPGTGIATGTVVATTRFLLSYDMAFTPNITIGARLGYAIGGGPPAGQALVDPADPSTTTDDVYDGGTSFLPLHAELRGTYWFGQNVLAKKGLRPYVALGGGMAQVDAKVPVTVKDCSENALLGNPTSANPEADCVAALTNFDQTAMPDVQLDAYKKMGQGFITLAGGLAYAFKENMAVQLNVNFMYMLPSSGPVIEPSLGFEAGL